MSTHPKRWCRISTCYRDAAPGSDFCRVKHGWWEPEPVVVPVAIAPPLEPVLVAEGRDDWFDLKPVEPLPPVLTLVRDCVGCEESFEQEPRQGRPFLYCDTCRGIAA